MSFLALRTEGGLLPIELLERIARGDRDLEHLDDNSYRLVGEKRNEAITRAWSRLLGVWTAFRDARAAAGPGDPLTGVTRDRLLLPLFETLGYGRLQRRPALDLDGRSYPISHGWEHLPIHLVGCGVDLDRRTPGVAGAASASPYGLVQEALNRSDDSLWGLVSNGVTIRLLRDNFALTRPAYVEFDLEAICEGQLYPDFVLLWTLLHASRFEGEASSSVLESWAAAAREQGTRARETLRKGVEEAIAQLGSGLFEANPALREQLESGAVSPHDLWRELLRLAFQLLFVFTAEDRDLLLLPELAPDADTEALRARRAARERYAAWYSTRRLRDLARKPSAATRHPDLWRGLGKILLALGDDGCDSLAVPALGGIFRLGGAVDPRRWDVANSSLLAAFRALAYTADSAGHTRPVDFRNLGSEELGSVYESLLELHPRADLPGRSFTLTTAAGNERKTTGSYYTPTSLIEALLDSALDPVVDDRLATARRDSRQGSESHEQSRARAERALLSITVCDPACGSGHFLIAAANRIARRLAQVRSGDDEPSPTATREALRDVVAHCIHGVDLNPMAIELCKVALWLEALVPGKPLAFLDHHLRVGNSLLGATPELLRQGIPDEAFKPLEGDDPEYCRKLKADNKKERAERRIDFGEDPWDRLGDLATELARLDALPDDTLDQVRRKEQLWGELSRSDDALFTHLWADSWCAAFVQDKRTRRDEQGNILYGITQEVFRKIERNPHAVAPWLREQVRRLTEEYRFFHWHLEFPGVVGENAPGFTVLLGNPPWEHVELKEQEFFASRAPDLAALAGEARKREIEELERGGDQRSRHLHAEYRSALRSVEATNHLVRSSGRFPLTARGRINTYPLFAELMRSLIARDGRVGVIVPSGIATDDTTKFFFGDLVDNGNLAALFDFENHGIFPAIDSRIKFCLLTVTGAGRPVSASTFVFFAHDVAEVQDTERRIELSAADIRLINPNTKTCPIFRSRRDAELTKAIYRRIPILIREQDGDETQPSPANPWGLSFMQGLFNMTSGSASFRQRAQLEAEGFELSGNVFVKPEHGRYLPLYEAKMIHHFDHRFGDYAYLPADSKSTQLPDVPLERLADPHYAPLPRYWVPEAEVEAKLTAKGWNHGWLLGWRDVVRSGDVRTVINAAIPAFGVGDKYLLALPTVEPRLAACLLAGMASFAFDYGARQKVGGTSLKYFTMKQLAAIPPSVFEAPCAWAPDFPSVAEWLCLRVLELTYTAWDLQPFAQDLGYDGPPFAWDESRRRQLRAELDAAFLHLYLGTQEEWAQEPESLRTLFPTPRHAAEHILDSFPIVAKNDIKQFGDYRTKLLVLAEYDRLAAGETRA